MVPNPVSFYFTKVCRLLRYDSFHRKRCYHVSYKKRAFPARMDFGGCSFDTSRLTGSSQINLQS
jgi:hypothetical protein